jgi:hypothetical protein
MIQRAAFSAIISVGALVLPLVIKGMTLASTTRRPATPPGPRTRRRASSTASGSSVAAHLGRADRMKNGGGDVAGQPCQFLVGLKLHTRFPFLWLVSSQRRLRGDQCVPGAG